MLRTDLIKVIQSGTAWAFVGSGASVDSGCPSWNQLLSRVLQGLPKETRLRIEQDSIFKSARDKTAIPQCFSRLAHFATREKVESLERSEITQHEQPTEIHKEGVDW